MLNTLRNELQPAREIPQAAFPEATHTGPWLSTSPGFFFVLLFSARGRSAGWKAGPGISCQAPTAGHPAAAPPGARQGHPPPSFAIHRAALPSPHHVTAAWTPGLFFPSAQPQRAGASEPIHSNCVTMSPGAQGLSEPPGPSPSRPRRGRRPAGLPRPRRPPARPPAHTRGAEVKLSWAAPAPRRPLPRPAQPGPPRLRTRPGHPPRGPACSPPRRLLPAPAPGTPSGRAAAAARHRRARGLAARTAGCPRREGRPPRTLSAAAGSPGRRGPAGSCPSRPTPTPSRTGGQQTRRRVRAAPARAAPAATTPPAARRPPLRLTPASLARVPAPAASLTPQPKLSYLPNPSPLPSLSSFVFPLPSTPRGLSLLPALSLPHWAAGLPLGPSPSPLGNTVVRLGGRACIDFCVVFTGEDGVSITTASASDWIAAETPGTQAKLRPRNGLWVRSLNLPPFLWETAGRRNRLDYISQRCVESAVLIVNKSHRDTCISSFVLVSRTKGRGRRKGVF